MKYLHDAIRWCLFLVFLLSSVASAQDAASQQGRILSAYFDLFTEQWVPPLSFLDEQEINAGWTTEETAKYFPAVARANPKTADDWRKLAKADKRSMLAAYYAVLGPEAAPDSNLLRPLADFVVGFGGNADTLAQAVEQATPGQVIGILPGVHVGEVALTNGVILIGLGRSSEVIIQGRVKDPIRITGGDALLCGLTFRFQSQNGATMYALDATGGSVTVVSCRAENDSQAGFVVREQASARFLSCMAENNKYSGFVSFDRSRLKAVHCRSSGNGFSGFDAQADLSASFSRCVAKNNKVAGFTGCGRARLEATHCRSVGNGHAGFAVLADSSGTLTRCVAESNKEAGFAGLERARLEATHCRSVGNGNAGFAVQADSSGALTRCVAENNKYAGFAGLERARLEASGCRSSGNGTHGFALQTTSHATLTRCVAEKNSEHGFVSLHQSRLVGMHLCAHNNKGFSLRSEGTSVASVCFFEATGNGSGDSPECVAPSRVVCMYVLKNSILLRAVQP